MQNLLKHILRIILITLSGSISAQNKPVVTVVDADRLTYEKDLVDAQRLLGNVVLKYDDAYLQCDSAYLYATQDFDAFGQVRINQGDSLFLTGKSLHFDKETAVASMRESIRLKNQDITLTTDALDYNLDDNIAHFWGGGKIVNPENKNTLTSQSGVYDVNSGRFRFKDDVKLSNPDYTVYADTLVYSDVAEKAWFLGPTDIHTRDADIYCENGWFDTRTQWCQFSESAVITTGSTTMQGDSIIYNGESGFGEIFCNVLISDTTSNYVISGDYGWHDQAHGKSFVTERALMTQVFDQDSLTLHADTLLAMKDSSGHQNIHAYHGVRFFKPDLQGVADSLVYSESDSLLTMYHNPILWSEENQIIGDTIQILTYGGAIQKLFVFKNSFISSEALPGNYNQIKGKHLTGYFSNNALRRVEVIGNGQVVYFPLDESDPDAAKIIGVNNAECSSLNIYVNQNRIERVSLLDKPSGALHPNSIATASDKTLKGFVWVTNRRPLSIADLFRK
ncbi:MAG: hypothetical protein KDC12_04375 [Flavobacteriales bacterium]|nr:hypothetical protein [Flavobacteriales bacterium]